MARAVATMAFCLPRRRRSAGSVPPGRYLSCQPPWRRLRERRAATGCLCRSCRPGSGAGLDGLGAEFGPCRGVGGGRELAHVQPSSAMITWAVSTPTPGPHPGAAPATAAGRRHCRSRERARRRSGRSRCRLAAHRAARPDAPRSCRPVADLGLQGADQVQQQADLIGVHLPEPPGERLGQPRLLRPEPAEGQPGEHPGIAFAGHERGSIARPDLPNRSDTTADTFTSASSRIFSTRCLWREHSAVSEVRSRVSARRSRIGSGGTNEGRSMPRSFNLHNQMQSSLSVFGGPERSSRPGR